RVRPMPRSDPRFYQIAALGVLLIYGIGFLKFEIEAQRALVLLATVLLTQLICTGACNAFAFVRANKKTSGQPSNVFSCFPAFQIHSPLCFDPKSALISGLSLCLLLRSNSFALVIAAAVITIASKFLLRIN